VNWWEEPSVVRRLAETIEQRITFGLWLPRAPAASGELSGYNAECSFDDLMRLRYGIEKFVAEPFASPEPPPRDSVLDASDYRTLDSLPAPSSSGGR
jgi:hypothetical protein